MDEDEGSRASLILTLRSAGHTARGFISPADFLERLKDGQGGCVVLDLGRHAHAGLPTVNLLSSRHPRLSIIVLCGRASVQAAVAIMKAGAADFIEKPAEEGLILQSVRRHMDALSRADRQKAHRQEVEARLASLSERERQVLHALVEGGSNRQIADELLLSRRTIENHRASILSKMQASGLAELIRMVVS